MANSVLSPKADFRLVIMTSPSRLRTRSLSSQVSPLRKVPPVRLLALAPLPSVRLDQQRIRRQADLAITQFNSRRAALLQAKKADWSRESWRLLRSAKRKWLYQAKSPEVYGAVGRVRSRDVLDTSLHDFSACARLDESN